MLMGVLVLVGPLVTVNLEDSANLALLPEEVADFVREDLVLPSEVRCVVDDILAEDHIAVRVRGVFDLGWVLEEVGVRALSSGSRSISSAEGRRIVRCGDAEMSSALRTFVWSSESMVRTCWGGEVWKAWELGVGCGLSVLSSVGRVVCEKAILAVTVLFWIRLSGMCRWVWSSLEIITDSQDVR